MKSLVIDASIPILTLLPGPHRRHVLALLEDWHAQAFRLVAPTLWRYEVTSALTKSVRFDVITRDEAIRALESALALSVELISPDAAQDKLAFEWTLRLQRAAAYDSYYLALAQALDCDLWTADTRLFNAARQPWVKLASPSD